MPLADIPRRMTIVRLRDGRLVVFNAVALAEDDMRSLERFSTPAFLMVPNAHHRLDAKIWKDRYPNLEVIAPPGARAKVEEAVPVAATGVDFSDPNVAVVTVSGTRDSEAALELRGSKGATLILNDMVGNMRKTSGFGGWLLRLLRFAGDEPRIPVPVKLTMIKDKARSPHNCGAGRNCRP